MAIFIVIGKYVIQCIGQSCQEIGYIPTEMMIAAGTLELIFEILGVAKIYRNVRRRE